MLIPTNKPTKRKDQDDIIYKDKPSKYNAIVKEIQKCYELGQPVLVGTAHIDKSEEISALLRRARIPHNVLNAKYHEREAEIIAQAGRFKAVTIATNMAGRGTDILLGGNPEFMAKAEVPEEDPSFKEVLKKFKAQTDAEKEKVIASGGLFILGTERHESRRIDNQLRGRSGRQGDPGSTRFFVSFEDDLMRRFAPEWLPGMMSRLGLDDDTPIESKMVTRAIEQAQQRVESHNFDIRKHVVEYDDVMNTHRDVIYKERDKVLAGESMRDTVMTMLEDEVGALSGAFLQQSPPDLESFRAAIESIVSTLALDALDDEGRSPTELTDEALEVIVKAWTQEVFSHEGKFWKFKDISIWPRPFQQPHPPIYIPFTGSKETIELAGKHNFSAVIPPGHPGVTHDIVDYYAKTLAKHGHQVTPNHLCLFTDAYVAESAEAAVHAL